MVITGSTRNRFVPLRAGHVGSNPTLSAIILFRFNNLASGPDQSQLNRFAERCPSWPKERDWKSRVLLKGGTVGSNPTLSAKFCIAKFGEISPLKFIKFCGGPANKIYYVL